MLIINTVLTLGVILRYAQSDCSESNRDDMYIRHVVPPGQAEKVLELLHSRTFKSIQPVGLLAHFEAINPTIPAAAIQKITGILFSF